MIKLYCVYKITNLLSGKCYIGKTKSNPNRRWKDHVKVANSKNNKNIKQYVSSIHKAIAKYKVENFSFEILEYFQFEKEAYDKEVIYIKQFNSYYKGYNETLGGRAAKGTARKLTNKQIYFIFKDYAENGKSSNDIVDKYELCKESILDILHRRSYIDIIIPDELVYKSWLKLRCSHKESQDDNYKSKKQYNANKIRIRSIFDDFISEKYTIKQLADKYNMVIGNLYFILNRETFKNIKVPKDIIKKTNKLLLEIEIKSGTNPSNRISNKDIKQIFLLYSEGISANKLSEKFNETKKMISEILYRKKYSDVEINIKLLSRVNEILNKKRLIVEFSDKNIVSIFNMYSDGYNSYDIADLYKSNQTKIVRILRREIYSNVEILESLKDFVLEKINSNNKRNKTYSETLLYDMVKEFVLGVSYKNIEKKYHIDPRNIKKLFENKGLFDKELQDKVNLEINRRELLKIKKDH